MWSSKCRGGCVSSYLASSRLTQDESCGLLLVLLSIFNDAAAGLSACMGRATTRRVVASSIQSSKPGASLKILPWPSSAAAASPSAVPAGHSASPMAHLDVKP